MLSLRFALEYVVKSFSFKHWSVGLILVYRLCNSRNDLFTPVEVVVLEFEYFFWWLPYAWQP